MRQITPSLQVEGAAVYQGRNLDVLPLLPDQSVHCCVTSPPYYGLRDYGHDGQIGLEESPDEYVAQLVAVFREVWRVLRDDGTLWLNLGDSYNGQSSNRTGQNGFNDGRTNRDKRYSVGGVANLKPKDLIGIPWRVAFALQSDGWYLRQDIIWHKPNPMPESVRDRCTKAHEYIFLLSKSDRYFFDSEAMQEPASGRDPGNQRHKYTEAYESSETEEHRTKAGLTAVGARETRNRRSVWTVATKPYPGSHFAVFPPNLIEPCILAGCPAGGTVLDPFTGSGTTGEVSIANGRNFTGVELNPDYFPLIRERLTQPVQLNLFNLEAS